MNVELFTILAIGFGLGLKHAIEPDHVIAVSTIAGKSRNVWRSALSGVYWGVGHTTTLFIVGMVLIVMKGEIPEQWAMGLEMLVGLMLIVLGALNLRGENTGRTLPHGHYGHYGHSSSDPHDHPHFLPFFKDLHIHRTYFKSTCIGFIHGLAGSAAMTLMTMQTVKRAWEGALYILIFGTGTIAGMMLFSTVIGIPFALSSRNVKLKGWMTRLSGVASMLFGIFYLFETAAAAHWL